MTEMSALGLKVTGEGITKTTSDLDKFAAAATKAGAAAKPINLKVTGSAAAALTQMRALEKALTGVRAAARTGLNIRVGTAGNAKAISDIAKMGDALRSARAAARTPINVRVTATGASAAITELNRFAAAASAARAASGNISSRVSASGSPVAAPSSNDVSSTNAMASAMRGLLTVATAYAALRIGREFLDIADGAKMLTAQLKLATAESGSFAVAQADVRRIAIDTRSDLESTAKLYGNFQRNASQLGITQAEAARATETVAKAFRVSGAATVEASQGTRQLVQALQSGVLRGDEFNTIMEAAPRLSKLFADSLGVTQGQLRKLAGEGELTSKKLTEALTNKKFTDSLDKEFGQLPATFSQAVQQMETSLSILVGAFDSGSGLSGAVASFIMGTANGFKDMEMDALRWGQTVRAEVAGATAAFAPFISKLDEVAKWFSQEFTLNLNLDQDYKDIDNFTGWLSQQGILGGLLTGNGLSNSMKAGGGKNDFTSGTTMMADANRARAAEYARQQAQQAGGFAGRWLDRANQDGGSYARVTAGENAVTAAKKKHASAAENLAARLKRESEATETLIEGLYKSAAAFDVSTAAGQRAKVEAEAAAKGIKSRADVDAYVAQQLRKNVAEQINAAAENNAAMADQARIQAFVNDAVSAGTILAEDASTAIANMAEQQKILTAAENADTQGKAAAEVALKRLTEAQAKKIALDKQAQDNALTSSTNRQIEDVKLETRLQGELGQARLAAMRGLNGQALEDELLNIGAAHEKAAIGARAEADAAREVALGHTLAAEAILRKAEADKTQVDVAADIERQNVALSRQAEILGSLNGLATGPLGNLLSAFTSSNPIASLIGSGGIGSLVGMASVPGRQQYQEQAKIIADSISSVFGVSGPFATMLAGALQGSSLGSLGSSLVGGNSTGGAIGGALGGALMSGGLGKSITKGLTGALGEALGGALSSAIPVIGGIAGSLLGNLLKKDKWGSTIVSAGGSQGTFGNSGTSRAGSSSLAAAFNETLGRLATSLDATLGEFAVSIGVTNGKINVNPGAVSGMIGTTKQSDTIDFGEDQAAALKYAIQNAIEDGALVGLSEGWKKFLLASDNVEAQYQKLSNLQSAYDELDSIKNPQAFALASLDKAFNALRDTAYRAGDDMVRIEELYQLKRAEVIEDANSDALELLRTNRSVEIEIMQLEGKSVEALSAARLMEQEGLDASTIALMTRRNALQDEAAITEKAAEATRLLEEARKSELDSLLSLRERLFTARGDDAGLRNFQRALEYEKASAAEREALDQIYKAEDAARNAAAAAERRAAAEAKAADIAAAKSSLQIELLRALGDEEAAVALERKKALDATDASLRSLQMQVWAAQDAAKALDEAKASFGQFATSLREFRDQLIAGDRATADAYRAAQVKFMTTAALAATGDVTALGKLQGVSESFLSASRDRATSQLQVDRDKAAVLQALNAGIDVSDDRVDAANAQLEAVREGNSAILALTAESKRGNDNAQVERVAIKSDLGVLRRLLTSLEQDGALRVTVAEID